MKPLPHPSRAPDPGDGARPGHAHGRITEEQIRHVVLAFYTRVRDDRILGPVFADRLDGRWSLHLDRMCDFWSTVLLGSRRFHGDPMGAHTGIPGIAPDHFDRWMSLFYLTAREHLPPHLAADIHGRAARMRVGLEGAACPEGESACPEGESASTDPESRTEPPELTDPRNGGHS